MLALNYHYWMVVISLGVRIDVRTEGMWVCKSHFSSFAVYKRAKWKHKWGTLSIGDKTCEAPPPRTRAIVDSIGMYEACSDDDEHTIWTALLLCELLHFIQIERLSPGQLVYTLVSAQVEILPRKFNANTRVRPHFRRSAAPRGALEMYPVTCQQSHFTHPTEVRSELAGLTTPTNPRRRSHTLMEATEDVVTGNRKCLLPWEEVSNKTASQTPPRPFGEILPVGCFLWWLYSHWHVSQKEAFRKTLRGYTVFVQCLCSLWASQRCCCILGVCFPFFYFTKPVEEKEGNGEGLD